MLVEIATTVLHHDQLGTLRKGERHDLPDVQAREFAAKGWVTAVYDTKVVISEPYEDKAAAPRRRRKAGE